MHLAQLNVGRLKAPIDNPMIDDFRMNLARINALAEASPGYVWRLQDESGNATVTIHVVMRLGVGVASRGRR